MENVVNISDNEASKLVKDLRNMSTIKATIIASMQLINAQERIVKNAKQLIDFEYQRLKSSGMSVSAFKKLRKIKDDSKALEKYKDETMQLHLFARALGEDGLDLEGEY